MDVWAKPVTPPESRPILDKEIGIRDVAVKKCVFLAVVKNTYLTRRPLTPVLINVYRGFV
jgi:hypothetical protein